jgi:catechol 2,3-dioxygenase-like lactoylglutathione lyase family enzyme
MARLAHVNIRTPRFAETVAFYERVLGLTAAPAATRPDSDRHAWLVEADGRASVHIQGEEAGAGVGAATSPAYHHIAFDCTDAGHWRERLRGLGERFDEIAFAEAGLLQFNLVDPNGLKLELTFRAGD